MLTPGTPYSAMRSSNLYACEVVSATATLGQRELRTLAARLSASFLAGSRGSDCPQLEKDVNRISTDAQAHPLFILPSNPASVTSIYGVCKMVLNQTEND